MAKDILLYETGNGGDMSISNNDLDTVEMLLQQAYICLFGGNIEADTRGDEIESEIREDWWANSLHFKDSPGKQFNSDTERTLNTTAINSSGRIKIIRAVEGDLKNLKKIANFSVDVQINSTNKITIFVKLSAPDNQQDKTLQILWDNAKKEIIFDKII